MASFFLISILNLTIILTLILATLVEVLFLNT